MAVHKIPQPIHLGAHDSACPKGLRFVPGRITVPGCSAVPSITVRYFVSSIAVALLSVQRLNYWMKSKLHISGEKQK